MKKLILLAAVLFGFTMISKAQTSPEFKFEEETHNFGKIAADKPATCEFKFTNVGEQPIIITNVEASCGCTQPTYTKTPIQKGQSGVISVTYTPAGIAMPFAKNVTITSNAKTPIKVLYIKGETVK